ncbi:MAG: dihydroorotase [Pseudohongiellaceae bacterium]
MSSDTLRLIRPDDWHLHLRDEQALATTVGHSARTFARAVVMPNLDPPVTTVALAHAYRERIMAAIPADTSFQPLMTLYLTDATSADEIRAAAADDAIIGVKYYPAGATTNAENGVTQPEKVYPLLELMDELDLPLLLHGEVSDAEVDIFDRERRFIDTVLSPLRERFQRLRIVLEHITTADAADFVKQAGPRTAATITVHHLLFNRNDLLAAGVRPHFYCLPVLKRNAHQQALIETAVSGHPRFFLGTDSAPHGRQQKESACGCAGIYSASAALELYAQVFEAAGALPQLEAFASKHGADFYGLPHNRETITLHRQDWQMPDSFDFGTDKVVPIQAGATIPWAIAKR